MYIMVGTLLVFGTGTRRVYFAAMRRQTGKFGIIWYNLLANNIALLKIFLKTFKYLQYKFDI